MFCNKGLSIYKLRSFKKYIYCINNILVNTTLFLEMFSSAQNHQNSNYVSLYVALYRCHNSPKTGNKELSVSIKLKRQVQNVDVLELQVRGRAMTSSFSKCCILVMCTKTQGRRIHKKKKKR